MTKKTAQSLLACWSVSCHLYQHKRTKCQGKGIHEEAKFLLILNTPSITISTQVHIPYFVILNPNLTKVWLNCHSFIYSFHWHVLTHVSQKNMENRCRNSFVPFRRVWLSLRQFLCTSNLLCGFYKQPLCWISWKSGKLLGWIVGHRQK